MSMNICIYNLYHIGDAYFMSSMLNVLCKYNPGRTFYYAITVGDAFFRHIPNLQRIGAKTENYRIFCNGLAPESLVDTRVLRWLQANTNRDTLWKRMHTSRGDFLFIHAWSSVMGHNEFRHEHALRKWYELIQQLNSEYGLDLHYPNPESIPKDLMYQPNVHTEIPKHLMARSRVFVYNFRTRSVPVHPHLIYDIVRMLRQRDGSIQIILPMYDAVLANVPNVLFCDRDFGIIPNPSCENLLHTWNIALMCDEIYILPCGACWLMYNDRVSELCGKVKVYMANNPDYVEGLNQSLAYFTGTLDNIKNVTIVHDKHGTSDANQS